MFPIIFLEVITAIIATIYYQKMLPIYRKYFLIYIWLVSAVEISGIFTRIDYPVINVFIYNLYTFFEFNLIFLMYYSILSKKSNKQIIIVFTIILNTLIIYNSISLGSTMPNPTSFVTGSLMVTIIALLYLKDLLNSDQILNYKTSPLFWITTGMLVYYLGFIPFQAGIFVQFLPSNARYIPFILSVFYYIFINIGMIWGQKEK